MPDGGEETLFDYMSRRLADKLMWREAKRKESIPTVDDFSRHVARAEKFYKKRPHLVSPKRPSGRQGTPHAIVEMLGGSDLRL